MLFRSTSQELNSTIDRNISFANLGVQADTRFLPQNFFFPVTDPFLSNPEKDDFRLLQGSIALGKGPGGTNFGSVQSQGIQFPTTKVIFVDYDKAIENGDEGNGKLGTPFQNIDQALNTAQPGDKIFITAKELPYDMDLEKQTEWVPGWGQISYIGLNKEINGIQTPPKIKCKAGGENSIHIKSQRFISLQNFHIQGSSSCTNGIDLENSRHIELGNLIIQGHTLAGLKIDSTGGTTILSSLIFDNDSSVLLQGTSHKNQQILFDKLTIASNQKSVSVTASHRVSFSNTIFSSLDATPCLTSTAETKPTSMEIRLDRKSTRLNSSHSSVSRMPSSA